MVELVESLEVMMSGLDNMFGRVAEMFGAPIDKLVGSIIELAG